MTVDEFKSALRCLLNDAIRSGIDIDELLTAAEAELHPSFDEVPQSTFAMNPTIGDRHDMD